MIDEKDNNNLDSQLQENTEKEITIEENQLQNQLQGENSPIDAQISEDKEGIYFILKGDNNPNVDPGKIRCEQIQRKLIGVLY